MERHNGYHLGHHHRILRWADRQVDHAWRSEAKRVHLTTVLGIIGSVLATWLGQAIGWYGPGDGANFIGAIVGAVIILLAWGQIAKRA
jgi:uncharacterized membrane protein YeaQ/YmgE (transglycosylase-associated protein family)